MSKNAILPKSKKLEVAQTDTNIEDLIIRKMEQTVVEVPQTEETNDPQRVNFMMPRYLYDMMKDKLHKRSDKMSNYLISLVRKDLGDDY
jgi:hypothetical protein